MLAKPWRYSENPALANLDDKFVFIVGPFGSSTDFYNIACDEWTKGPMMTAPRIRFSACILAGILYAFNGTTS